MSARELQTCNWAINGCMRRSFFVFFSYSFRAATRMARKLEECEGVWDILNLRCGTGEVR